MVEMHAPRILRMSAIFHLGTFCPYSVSLMTVEVASSIENAESIPRVNKVSERRIDQKFEYGRVSMAVGYAMNARPIDATFPATGELMPLR